MVFLGPKVRHRRMLDTLIWYLDMYVVEPREHNIVNVTKKETRKQFPSSK